EPRHEGLRYRGDVLHLQRDAVPLSEYDVLDVVALPALGQIRLATAVKQSNAANVHGLLANRDLAPSNVDVGIAECGDHLRQRDVIGIKLMKIDIHVVLLGGAPP